MPPSPQDLLQHSAWLRRLAASLVGDAAADDLVQETWIAAMRSPPDGERPLRPWLSTVLRNLARMTWRSSESRSRREAESDVPEPTPSPEDVVARAQTQHRLVELVLAMAEPYRSTLLLRYFEGLEPSEIARQQDVPAGTVRWRLKEALARLRAQLDQASAGNRRAWMLTLAPLAKGALVAKTSSKLLVIVVLLLMLLAAVGAGAWKLHRAAAGTNARAARTLAAGGTPGHAQRSSSSGDGRNADGDLAVFAPEPGAPARRVAGRVMHGDAPVAGALVRLTSTYASLGNGPQLSATTDAKGHFDFGSQAARTLQVVASAPGLTSAGVTVSLGDPTVKPAPDQLELRLRGCELALTGRITDAAGGPITGARLRRFDDLVASQLAGEATSDTDGRYTLCVTGGLFGLIVEADGYGAMHLVLLVQQGHEGRDFVLTPEAVVTGRVVTEAGAPVGGAVVAVEPSEGARERSAARYAASDAAGRFRLVGIAPGKHRLNAVASGLSTSDGMQLELRAAETRDVEVVVKTRTRVSGVVLSGGRPVAGAHVGASSVDSGWSRESISREDGHFALERVPLGQIRLDAEPFEVVTPTSLRVDASGRDDVVIEVRPMACLAGRVLRHGQPARDVELSLGSADSFEWLRTDGAGRFERRGLPPSRYTLTPMSQALGAGGDELVVDLARGQCKRDLELTLSMNGTIAGRVVDQDGRALADATVTWTRTDGKDTGWSPTDAEGRYRAWGLSGGGEYTVTINPSVGSLVKLAPASGSFPVVALADGDAHHDGANLSVRVRRRSIAGRVLDASGAPVADVRVELTPETPEDDFAFWRNLPRALTDTEGRFHVEGLREPSYTVRARAADGGATLVHGVAAGRDDVTLRLDSPGTIEGQVVGFTHAPEAYAWRIDMDSDFAAAVETSGRFQLRGLAAGHYTVVALGTDGEAAIAGADVGAGATAHVTLTMPGTAVVEGRVLDFASGQPVAGIVCGVRVRMNDDRPLPYWRGPRDPSDAAGRFRQASTPAGMVEVACEPDGERSGAAIATTLDAGQTNSVELMTVARRDAKAPLAFLGVTPVPNVYAPMVQSVEAGSPAASAGLAAGDVLVAVDGRNVGSLTPEAVSWLVCDRAAGTTVRVGVRRGATTRELVVRLVARPADATAAW